MTRISARAAKSIILFASSSGSGLDLHPLAEARYFRYQFSLGTHPAAPGEPEPILYPIYHYSTHATSEVLIHGQSPIR